MSRLAVPAGVGVLTISLHELFDKLAGALDLYKGVCGGRHTDNFGGFTWRGQIALDD